MIIRADSAIPRAEESGCAFKRLAAGLEQLRVGADGVDRLVKVRRCTRTLEEVAHKAPAFGTLLAGVITIGADASQAAKTPARTGAKSSDTEMRWARTATAVARSRKNMMP